MKKKFVLITSFLCCSVLSFSSTKLFFDTEYKILYNEYSNLDFDFSTSTDVYTKIFSVLNLTTKMLFQNKIEWKTNICSIGEFGSYTVFNSTKQYVWENLPYPDVHFFPWFAEFYLKYKYETVNPVVVPYTNLVVDNISFYLTIGRQKKEFIEGFVMGDNRIGYDGISAQVNFGRYFYFDSLITRVASQAGFVNNKSFDVYSFLLGSKYFQEFDFGVCFTLEQNKFLNDKKIFYEIFIKREQKNYNYIFEYAIQRGSKDNKNYSGSLWYFKGEVLGKNKYTGESSASMVWMLSSGGDEKSKFSPSFTKMYDYMEPYGIGEFAKANTKTIFFNLPEGYSGVFVLGLNLLINPIKKLFAGFSYYLYSSPNAPDDKPDPSSTEKTLGAKKAIGLEYDILAKYELSNFASVNFVYSIFNPTKNVYSQKGDNATKVSLSLTTKF